MPGTVFATFSVLKNHVKLRVNRENPSIDNISLTNAILIPQNRCISDSSVPNHVIETFCFFTATFTIAKHMNVTAVEAGDVPHPGVGPWSKKHDDVVHHAYYQWVPFFLFFQAIFFYVPHYLWRSIEGGRLKVLVSGLQLAFMSLEEDKIVTESGTTVPSKADRDEMIQQIRIAFINRLHLNRPWAYYLALCELLNFVNVLAQIYLSDLFLGGAFLTIGHRIAHENPNEISPLDQVFPKVTKCTFYKYGPSGTIQTHDALCVMALNIVNEKIYSFFWFWFIILALVTWIGLLWRILTMILHARSTTFNKFVFGLACPGKYSPWDVLKVTHDYYFGDWLFLYYIAKNVDNYVFKDLLQQLAEDLEARKRIGYKSLPLGEEEPLKAT